MNNFAKDKGGGRGLLIVLSLCSFLVGLDSMIVSPLIPQILEVTNTQIEKGGLLITAYALLYGLTAPLFGPISDKVGRKIMIVIGMLIFSVGTFLTGISNSFTTILIYRAVTGLSGAIFMPSIFALVGDYFPNEKRGKAMGLIMGAMIGSTVLGVPIGAFISKFINWNMTFRLIGLMGIVVFIVTIIKLPNIKIQKQSSASPIQTYLMQFKFAFANSSVRYALLVTFLWTIGLHGLFGYLGVFYNKIYHLDVGSIGIVIFFAGLASVIGNVFGGKWSDLIGQKKVVYYASFFATVFVLLFSSITLNIFLSVFLHILWSASVGVGQSSLTALVSQLSPKVRGTVMALNSSTMYLGMTIASSIASLLLINFSFMSIGVLCSVSVSLVLLVIGKVIPSEKLAKKSLDCSGVLNKR